MNRITSIMTMHARDRGTWFVIPASVLAAVFAVSWLIVLTHDALIGSTEGVFTAGLAIFLVVMMVGGIGSIGGTYPFAVGFGARRRDYLLGTLIVAVAVSAAWAIVLEICSLLETYVFRNWGVGMHFFHLPFFSDGAFLRQFCWTSDAACAQADTNYAHGSVPLAQFWVSFVLLLFMFLTGALLGSVFKRFGGIGVYIALGVAFLLFSVFVLLSNYWNWWGAIAGWLARQTAAGLAWWLLLPGALFAFATYAVLRRATV